MTKLQSSFFATEQELPLPETATVLLVEDDPAILEGIAELLEFAADRFEIEVLKAHNGRLATECMAEHTPDLIVSDVAMPSMNGYEFLEWVRKEPGRAHIPFVFLTAQTSRKQIYQGLSKGVELYLTKPFDSQELIELVETQLEKSLRLRVVREQRERQLKRELSRTLQHELRTPLTFVTAYLEFLNMGYEEFADPGELQEHLRGIQTGNSRLMRLVSDLIGALDVRTGEVATRVHEAAAVIGSPVPILQRAVDEMQAVAAKEGVGLVCDLPATMPTVFGDAERLEDAFRRLIDNAIKFTKAALREDGMVWVSAETTATTVRFLFRDNGIGFPMHVRDRLYDLFYQHDRSQWEQQGPGVGLTIVKGVVEAHNGYLDAISEPGNGATFFVELPIYTEGVSEPLGGAAETRKRDVSILIVEDDTFLMNGLCDLLTWSETEWEYDILQATNGLEALEVLKQRVPDIILSDIMMPEMDGYELLKSVRANRALAEIPFMFLSAKGDHKDVHLGRKLGVDEYLSKPYNTEYLLSRVATLVGRHFEKQQAELGNFDVLKEQVLASIEVTIVDSLRAISRHSDEMREMLSQGVSLKASRNADELKESLRGIQQGSAKLSEMVRNATTMVEIRTGAAASTFHSRAGMIENLGDVVAAAINQMKESAEFSDVPLPNPNVSIDLDRPAFLPPVYGEAKALGVAFGRLLHFLMICCDEAGGNVQILVGADDSEAVTIRMVAKPCHLTDDKKSLIAKVLEDNVVDTAEVGRGGADLAIFREYMGLHSAEISLNHQTDCLEMLVKFPAFDPIASLSL